MSLSPNTYKRHPPTSPGRQTQNSGLLLSAVFQGAQTDRGHAGTWNEECAAGRASEGIFLVPPLLVPEETCSW